MPLHKLTDTDAHLPGTDGKLLGSAGGAIVEESYSDTAAAETIPKTKTAGGGSKLDPDFVPDMVGDSGSGGTHGLVPAPGAGDASKVLKGDGTWGSVATSSYEDVVLGPEATASATTGDDQLATATTFSVAVSGNNRPRVIVGGLVFSFGWSTSNEYQSRAFHARNSAGTVVRGPGEIVSGDKLYYRGSVGGAQLDSSDKITVLAARA